MFALADPWNTHYTFLSASEPLILWSLCGCICSGLAKLFTSTPTCARRIVLVLSDLYLVKHAPSLSLICAFSALLKLVGNSQSLHVFLGSLKAWNKLLPLLIATCIHPASFVALPSPAKLERNCIALCNLLPLPWLIFKKSCFLQRSRKKDKKSAFFNLANQTSFNACRTNY